MRQEKKFPGMKLEESSLYTRLRLDAARTMHEGVKAQVKNLQGASRNRLIMTEMEYLNIVHHTNFRIGDKVRFPISQKELERRCQGKRTGSNVFSIVKPHTSDVLIQSIENEDLQLIVSPQQLYDLDEGVL